ncbi:uncharacterized protein LOC127855078 isoform X2 [Dreissena polymorpha]|uniref:uncharacterized protein LOC127855078 isoform X2 n=1 Tax=Dreissena polymorpha TaxID=45954 RepID=UPI0022646EE6|nr:uncharacterized protein LOC127855078 isoform X2 [Dreissena polymorpha]
MPDINIIAKGVNNENKTVTIPAEATIKELKKRVREAFRLPEEDDIRLLYTSKELCEQDPDGEEQYLKDYDLRNNATILIVIRVHGGSAAKVYGSDMVLATEPDYVTMDDSAGGQRAKMPCGHVVSNRCLFRPRVSDRLL